ncbi:hypothetical protein [Streptomyces caelestis]|uniref:hypothetical protein n=1 Tax=Streptomyces caelestis TaxID=36816 RepID=UPI0036F71397
MRTRGTVFNQSSLTGSWAARFQDGSRWPSRSSCAAPRGSLPRAAPRCGSAPETSRC